MLAISRCSHGPSTSQVLSSTWIVSGWEVSTSGGRGTYSGSYTTTGGSCESIRPMVCTSSRVPWWVAADISRKV